MTNVKSQLRYMGANILSEVNDALEDFREGVIPEVRKDAHDLVDGLGVQADGLVEKVQLKVLDVKARLIGR